jgi:putative endonuclease
VPSRQEIGAAGEEAAARHLRRCGLRIIERNLRLGRLGELDIVAMHRKTLVFAEVKSRLAADPISGFEKIGPVKQHKLTELAEAFIQRHPQGFDAVRFDALEVIFPDEALNRPQITYLPDAFRLT